MYDIIFLSFDEVNADFNYENLKSRFPRAQRVHGIKGIHQAHIYAAKKSFTKMFWVVDGDAEIVEEFSFDYQVDQWSTDCVHVWRSRNPVNHLEYGYGGVKLLPKSLTADMSINKVDMTTGISDKFKAIEQISNVTRFDTDPFNTWKSAFRECAKLSSGIIDRQDSLESVERLDVWCNVAEGDYAQYSIDGAIEGKKYGEKYRDNLEELIKINDFDWIKRRFNAR